MGLTPGDYTKLDRPYNDNLERTPEVIVDMSPNTGLSSDPSAIAGAIAASASTAPVQGKQMTDMYIDKFIKSRNYQPKQQGFYMDGQTGYAEFMKLFVGTGGIIGGFLDIPDTTSTNSFHVDASGNTWWGSPLLATSVAFVLATGEAQFKNATVTGILNASAGSVIPSSVITGSIPSSQLNLDIADRGWTQTCVFTAFDADTVTWTSGSFVASNGTTYTISASNTDDRLLAAGLTIPMNAKTYIYLDTNTSTTQYCCTYTASQSVGAGKVLIGVAQANTTEAVFTTTDGTGGQSIDASSIVSGSITANEIAASTITAGKMNVTALSAITANLGSITAGTITLDTSGYIRGGQSAYNTGTGFFLGYSTSAYKLSIGNPTTDYLTWDGTTLTVSALLDVFSRYTAYEGMTAGDFAKITNDSGTAKLAQVFGYSAETNVIATSDTGPGHHPSVGKIIKMSSSKVAIFYTDIDYPGSAYTRANQYVIIGTLSGKTWTWGASYLVTTGQRTNGSGGESFFIDACYVTANTVMGFYRSDANSHSYSKTFTIVVSGTTVSSSTADTWNWGYNEDTDTTHDNYPYSCGQVADGVVVITAYNAQVTQYRAKVGTWGGSSWTKGSNFNIMGSQPTGSYFHVWNLSANRIVVQTNGATTYTYTNSANTLTLVSGGSFIGTNQLLYLTGSSAGVMSYNDSGALKVASFTESGGAFTFSNTTILDASLTTNTGLDVRIGTLDFYYAYDNKIATAKLISGTGFTHTTAYTVTSSGVSAMISVDNNRFLSCNIKSDNSYLTNIVGDYDIQDILGTVRTTVSAAGIAQLQSNGAINASQAGLVIGVSYYVNPLAVLSVYSSDTINGVASTNRKVGYAVDTTKLLINIS